MSSKANKPEPFGYFRALPWCWEDCAQGDEGAQALYDEGAIRTQSARIAELEAEVERLRPNAERWEYALNSEEFAICQRDEVFGEPCWVPISEESAIDAARTHKEQP